MERMFSRRELTRLVVPLMIDQILEILMGTADTIMVTTIGSYAISGVALVNSINKLMIYIFSALATGGTIVCSQYLGRRDREGANHAAEQVLLSTLVLSLGIMALCLALRAPILRLIFGSVEEDVMGAALVYFLLSALSYPALALYNASAALFRCTGNSALPMYVSLFTNLLNIGGNALFIFVFGWGVAGAALSTLICRVLAALILLLCQRSPDQVIVIRDYRRLRPDFATIRLVLSIGIPTGLENGMFQFGKLAVQSTVSTLGTVAIAAQAMTAELEEFTSTPSLAIGLGLITVAGRCMGAGRTEEARFYIKRFTALSWVVVLGVGWAVYFLCAPITRLANMEPSAAALCCHLMLIISIVKPFVWSLGFTPVNGMKAAGDVKFSMICSTAVMWTCRVAISVVLCRGFGFGVIGVWIAWFVDWTVRAVVYTWRFRSNRWATKRVLKGPAPPSDTSPDDG